jgi:hypothetical protein
MSPLASFLVSFCPKGGTFMQNRKTEYENERQTMEPLDSLVRDAQEGDAEVFNRIVERFQDMACASAYAMIEDVHLAEDVALKDIAAFLDVPVTTVKKRLYDGRQRLKDQLVDVARDALQEQRPSITDTFPAKVRLLLAARLGDIDIVKELLAEAAM